MLICFRIVPVAVLIIAASVCAGDSLHSRIDAMIEAKASGAVNPSTSDEEFIRRVYLDLAGRIPTAVEAREFLANSDSSKREKITDQLLESDDYPRRMKELFHVMFMERRGTHEEWDKFLQESFSANKPWDQFVREILHPNADDELTRGSAFFITKRLEKYGQNPTDYPGLVRDVGRLFMGVDVQCAQCHDHLFIDDYKQIDYQGLFAYLGSVSIRRDVQFPAVAEKPIKKKIEFMSVFDMQPLQVGLRLPFGEEVEIPTFKNGEEYITPPDRKTKSPGVLKFSTLKVLGETLPVADNDLFKKNIVNRLWWAMMGRGLVHPLDLHHQENAPSHPELLQLLADEFASHKFDIKWMLRELALTKTYQRSGLLPGDSQRPPKPESYEVALERPLSAEQILRSLLLSTGELESVLANDKKDEKDAEGEELTYSEIYDRFKAALANPPREPEVDFSPTVKAALFLSNDDLLVSWLQPRDGNLVDRLSKIDDAKEIAEEVYLAILTRAPTDEERTEAIDYLSEQIKRRSAAVGNLAWALLTSTEFCVNH